MRAVTYRHVAVHMLLELLGTAVTSTRGRRKTDDELLGEFCAHALDQHYVAVVVDEADLVEPAALRYFRDLISEAARRDPRREVGSDVVHPHGIGVLLVGAPRLRPMLERTLEAGQRWTHVVALDQAKPEKVAGVYLAWFPRFLEHLQKVGRPAWDRYVSTNCTRGRPMPLRTLQNHARLYFRRMVTRYEGQVHTREDVPFDEAIFRYTAQEALWGRGEEDGRVS